MALTADLILFLIFVTVLNATFAVSNSNSMEKTEVSEQPKSLNNSGNKINSYLNGHTDDIDQTSIPESNSMSPQMSQGLDDLIDSKSSLESKAFLEFENIWMIEKSKFLIPLSKEEYKYNSQRILHGTSRTERNCSDDISFVVAAARMQIQWALEMIDANGQPGYGSLRHTVPTIGNFDRCMGVDTGQDFEGRYCTTHILISKINQTSFSPPLLSSLGLCFPSSCGGKDVEDFINEYFQSRDDITATAAYTNCQLRHLEFSTTAKIVIAICSIYAFILVVATAYDALYKRWWLGQNKNQCHNLDNNGDEKSAHFLMKKTNLEHESTFDTDMQKEKFYSQNEAAFLKRSKKSKILDQILMSFSVYTNTGKLFFAHQPQGSIGCLHGMRFLSSTWVILVHLLLFHTLTIENLRDYVDDAYGRWTYMVVARADPAVDTFFAMSGLLMAYQVLRELKQKEVTTQFFANFYIHRVWRLLPPCMLIMMTYVPLFKYIGKGPFWPQGGFEVNECKDSWWITMLYLNNFIKDDRACMGWTWSLSCEMQFYIISPLMFLPLFYFGWKGLLSPVVLLLASAICSGAITSAKDLPSVIVLDNMLVLLQSPFFRYYYVKPYTRIGPYIVGLITGFLLFKCKMKARLSKPVVILGWIAATATALAVIYGMYGHFMLEDQHSVEVRALYNALSRIAWGMSVCWVIFACANGYGGFVNTLLSWNAFVPLGKLSYCAYLIHPIVIAYSAFTRGQMYHYDNIRMTSDFMAVIGTTYMLSYVAYMAYEIPMAGLEKIFKGKKKD